LAISQVTLFAGERTRWPLWLPVALGTGAGLYFALPVEPAGWAGWAVTATGLVLAALAFRRPWPLALVAALLLGLGLAKLREQAVATPVLDASVVAHLTGRIVSLEPRARGQRLVLDEIRSGAFSPGQAPRRARITVLVAGDFHPGDWLSLTARLDAPAPPAEPGASDFGRHLYFESIGATGFAYGRARPIPPARPPGLWERASFAVEALRLRMTRRIQDALPASRGGIAAALVTGTRGTISEEDDAALRDAGLAHALSISGLHMAMVGGGIFWLLRAILAAFPSIVLRYPVKKWSAAVALGASAFYLVISGMEAAAVRAFVMLAVVMLAVLLDRPALTMRSLALAGSLLLILRPESIADAGFQMSFAAVAALIAVAEWDRKRERSAPHGFVYRHIRGIVLTSLVASLATAPFTLFHFGRAAHYAVLGNLLVMPVMGFWIMPLEALAVMLMPFGLERWVLPLLGEGIALMVRIGAWVSGLPGAVSLSSGVPLSALVLMTLGGLWIVIWQTRWRWWGVLPIALGVVFALLTSRPDMLVAPDGQTVAIRGSDGLLHFVRKPANRFVARAWLQRDGDGRDIQDAVGDPSIKCDGVGCVMKSMLGLAPYSPSPYLVAVSQKPEALADDCAMAKVVASTATALNCKGPAVVIDREAAMRGQGWRVTLGLKPHAESVRSYRGERPWVAKVFE
jgi:competence protein ComEC